MDGEVQQLADLVMSVINSCNLNIVEEPEQNLFPLSQRKVLEGLLTHYNKNPKNQLFITTHSPFIISYLTLYAKGAELKYKGVPDSEILKVLSTDSIVSGENISIYETDAYGNISLLKPYDDLPSDENQLNKAMAQQNEEFARLLDLEEKFCR